MLPTSNLDSDFFFDQTNLLMNKIRSANGKKITIIYDNNRVYQAFFKKFNCAYLWLTTDGIFLLYDFVSVNHFP